MHQVEAHEPTHEFLEMWQAAGSHLNEQVDGGIRSWLKAEPTPPWLEHLSFRLGNQLFFVRVMDQSGKVELPGNDEGAKIAAQKCGGHACVLPMKRSLFGGKWKAVHNGWGLVDAETGEAVNPIELITDEAIEISDWELNDIAVQVVRGQLEKDGYRVTGWVSNPEVHPAIWFNGASGQPEWVVVRAARYPLLSATQPENMAEIAKRASNLSPVGHFASVSIASADDVFDPAAAENGNFSPILRGHGLSIRYEGLVAYAHSESAGKKDMQMVTPGLINELFDECIQWYEYMAREHHAVPRALTGVTGDGQQFKLILNGLHLNHVEIAGVIKTALLTEGVVAYAYGRLLGLEDGTVELEVAASSADAFVSGFLAVNCDSDGKVMSLSLKSKHSGNDPENYPGTWFLTDSFKVEDDDALRYRDLWLALRSEARFRTRA